MELFDAGSWSVGCFKSVGVLLSHPAPCIVFCWAPNETRKQLRLLFTGRLRATHPENPGLNEEKKVEERMKHIQRERGFLGYVCMIIVAARQEGGSTCKRNAYRCIFDFFFHGCRPPSLSSGSELRFMYSGFMFSSVEQY